MASFASHASTGMASVTIAVAKFPSPAEVAEAKVALVFVILNVLGEVIILAACLWGWWQTPLFREFTCFSYAAVLRLVQTVTTAPRDLSALLSTEYAYSWLYHYRILGVYAGRLALPLFCGGFCLLLFRIYTPTPSRR